jgi:RNA polymerase sigma-70 factor (ECF subfamily)
VSGDADFEAVFASQYQAVLRTVYLVCHDYHQAQDITQEAFVQLLRRWESVRHLDRPGAWVRRVAIRLAVKSVRREKAVRHAEAQLAVPPMSEPDRDVMDAIRRLPAHQRAAVVLYYFEDLALADVAELMGCAHATARVHLHRARQRLSVLLEKEARHVD